MREIELDESRWARLKRELMTRAPDEALRDFEPPVRLTHNGEYITYGRETDDDPGTNDRAEA